MPGAVLTGDIIHSTKMTGEIRTALVTEIEKYMKQLRSVYGITFELYRGDSFQCLLKTPADALRIALMIKTFIRSRNPSEFYNIKAPRGKKKRVTVLTNWIFDARIAIGIGEVKKQPKKLSTADERAFYVSGRLLDAMKGTRQHLAIESEDEYNEAWKIEGQLLDALVRKTTALQCEVINFKLNRFTETEIANKLNVGQSAVNQRANSAEWSVINAMVERFEGAYENE